MKKRFYTLLIGISWVLIVIIYPSLISIYVELPLFIGFSGLMLVKGLEEENIFYTLISLLYMFSLEINLSLPLMLIPIVVMIFFIYLKNKLIIFKQCQKCINILTVILINIIYFIFILIYDVFTGESSIDFDITIIFSIIFDIIAAVLL